MATKLIAPRPGEGVEELTIMGWLKKVGDYVDEMESIVEVETDKVITEIPSPVAGTLLEILVPEGETVKVGEAMGLIGEAGEETPTEEPETHAAEEHIETKATEADSSIDEDKAEKPKESAPVNVDEEGDKPKAEAQENEHYSPLVKKLAEENKIDLTEVHGTGEGGRVTKEDVLAFLEGHEPAALEEKPKTTPAQAETITIKTTEKPSAAEGRLIPVSSIRKSIAEHMVMSLATSPHVLSVMEADLSQVLADRKTIKAEFEKEGINLTLTAYFIKAIAKTLPGHPLLNASWTDEGILSHQDLNIGFAVARGEDGLIVPVIHQAQNLSLKGIAKAINDLSERAREKSIKTEEVKGATFTLTNHGTGGSLFASPIINQPQLAILGTGMMQKRPVVITDEHGNDAIAIRPMIYLSLVFDHRAIDGESGDAFLLDYKKALENWTN